MRHKQGGEEPNVQRKGKLDVERGVLGGAGGGPERGTPIRRAMKKIQSEFIQKVTA